MDFVNKAFAQASELFRSMTPAARITTGLLLAAVVVSVGYLFNHQTASPDDYLMGGEPIASSQLPAMEAAFAKANLNNYQIDGNRIRVSRGQKSAFMGALADAGALPERFNAYLQNTLDKGGPFVSKQKQADMLKIATQNELSLILRSMKGIENASVLYDVQTDGGFHGKKTMTASVSIKPSGNLPLDEERVPVIRQLVAGAIAGLPPDSVAVTDLNSSRLFAPGTGSGAGGAAGKYGAAKAQFEKMWEEKIRLALNYVPGVMVTANVEVNPEIEHSEDETKIDPKAVTTSQQETNETSKSHSAAGGGRPGVVSQNGIPAANAAVAVGNNSSSSGNNIETEKTTSNQKNDYGTTVRRSRFDGLTPESVTVAIAVPSSYFEKIWREQHPAAPGDENKPLTKDEQDKLKELEAVKSKEITAHVSKIIPPDVKLKSKGTTDQVVVTTFQTLATTPLAAPSASDHAMAWLGQYWSTLGMCGLGLFALLMLRSMVRAVPATAPAPTASPALAARKTEEEQATAKAPETVVSEARTRLKRREKGGPSLRDELTDIVREDPDAAAAILRSWIGAAT